MSVDDYLETIYNVKATVKHEYRDEECLFIEVRVPDDQFSEGDKVEVLVLKFAPSIEGYK